MFKPILSLSTDKRLEAKPIYDNVGSYKEYKEKDKAINSNMSTSEIANVISDKLIHIVASNLKDVLQTGDLPSTVAKNIK